MNLSLLLMDVFGAQAAPYTPSPAAQFIISQNWAQLFGTLISGFLAYLAWRRSQKNAGVVDRNTETTSQMAERMQAWETADTDTIRRRDVYTITVPPPPRPGVRRPVPTSHRRG